MTTTDVLSPTMVRDLVVTFRDAVRQHAPRLNSLNVYPVPDGDTGTNMSRTLDAVVDEIDATDGDDPSDLYRAISHGSLMGARGNSGVILSQILRGIASAFGSRSSDAGELDGDAFAAALQSASDGAYQAVLNPIEGTILTVVRESAGAARRAADAGGGLSAVISAAHERATDALARTPDLLEVLREAGVVDAGGAGFVLLLDAARHVVDGVKLPESDVADTDVGVVGAAFDAVTHRGDRVGGVDGELDVSEQRYEVMYFLDLVDDRIDDFKQSWGRIGDSIVVVGGDGIWNCHVHTNDIGAAIESAIELDGRPRQIRVTDLFEEVDEEHARREAAMTADHAPVVAGLPEVTTAVVAVTSGDGLVELFGQLGVQGVVTGGQTMNPSTAELLDTVERVNADQVVILPNNKNIIPVAEQVDELTAKTVVVAPTRTMTEGLAALVVYDPEDGAAVNGDEMTDAAASVTTGEITHAVRDTVTDGREIAEGDWIGLVRGDGLVSASSEQLAATTELLETILVGDVELLTVLVGADADRATTDAIEGWLADHHANVAVEIHQGGQPLYPYLFGAE
ncbi:MAG: DAK2 domain-containing protein [Actinomycetota bacterium]